MITTTTTKTPNNYNYKTRNLLRDKKQDKKNWIG